MHVCAHHLWGRYYDRMGVTFNPPWSHGGGRVTIESASVRIHLYAHNKVYHVIIQHFPLVSFDVNCLDTTQEHHTTGSSPTWCVRQVHVCYFLPTLRNLRARAVYCAHAYAGITRYIIVILRG